MYIHVPYKSAQARVDTHAWAMDTADVWMEILANDEAGTPRDLGMYDCRLGLFS